MGILYLLYFFLTTIYAVSITYILAFRIGSYKQSQKIVKYPFSPKGLSASVIVPIYKEDTAMIKNALNSLKKQKNVLIDLIVVMKDPIAGQVDVVRSYSKSFNNLKVVIQKGKPSQNLAFIEGLSYAKRDYTCILCSDVRIYPNRLTDILNVLQRTNKDAGFGLLDPEINDTVAGRYTAIGKVFKQSITLRGRASLGLGWYIPGAFAVYRTALLKSEFKHLLKNNFVSQDFGLSFRLLTDRYDKCYFASEVVATELEKSTFRGWLLQQTRWFMGYFGMSNMISDLFSKANTSIKIGTVGLFLIWNIFPYALFIGLVVGLIGLLSSSTFLIAYAIAYALATSVILSLEATGRYGLWHQLSYWFMTSLINSLAVPLSIYGFIFATYGDKNLHVLFKR